MQLLSTIDRLIYAGVVAIVVAAIILILLRSFFRYIDKNPFTWSAITVKRLTDPVIVPVRYMLVAMRVDPIVAPIIVIVVFILVGFFVLQISSGTLSTIAGITLVVTSGAKNAATLIFGYLLYALIGLYELLIFARIIGIWFSVSYANRWMRLLSQLTEPFLAPLRRMIRPVGMFDISPIIAFVILWVLQMVVAGTLLKGWPVKFF